jgi:choline dehydrogenase-like flavoprotein
LLAKAQAQHRIGNFIARLHHPRIADPEHRNAVLSLLYVSQLLIPYEYRRRLQEAERPGFGRWLRHVRNILTGPGDAAAFAWHMLNDRFLAARKFPSIIVKSRANLFSVDFHAEQVPNPMSRVTLTTARDALGLPRLNVDWRYSPHDVRTVEESIALLARDFQRGSIGQLDYDPRAVELEMTRYGAYGGHHIGTTRMGLDPRTSVVDANCRVHGVDNLYIAGASVFPTSSQANPTLTVVALALRLAAHLALNAPARS